MKGLPYFYQSFYGHKFFRYFRRPPDFKLPGFRIQVRVKTPKQLYQNIHRNSGYHPCYIQTYDRGSLNNLKRDELDSMVIDRVFFDFDVSHSEISRIKKRLISIRSNNLRNEVGKQEELLEHLRNLIIEEHVAEPAIGEAKDFAVRFKESFGNYPALFFSGCKGCHAYTFFDHINVNINRALSLELDNMPYVVCNKNKNYLPISNNGFIC